MISPFFFYFYFIMSLIHIKEIGYGIKGDTLNMTIAIPKGSYLKEFWVVTQKDIAESDCTAGAGINYIEGVKNLGTSSLQTVMDKIFKYQCDYTDPVTNDIYSIYKLKEFFSWKYNDTKEGVGINVSRKDLSIITLKLDSNLVPSSFVKSSECGEDNSELRIPLYDLLPARLAALNTAKGLDNAVQLAYTFAQEYKAANGQPDKINYNNLVKGNAEQQAIIRNEISHYLESGEFELNTDETYLNQGYLL